MCIDRVQDSGFPISSFHHREKQFQLYSREAVQVVLMSKASTCTLLLLSLLQLLLTPQDFQFLAPHLFIIGHVAVTEQFWGHVLLSAPVSVQSPWGVELRHTVVSQLDVHTLLGMERPDEHIARLYVPVDNVEGVQVADAISNLGNRQTRINRISIFTMLGTLQYQACI